MQNDAVLTLSSARIVHVLFLDIVGFSRGTSTEQSRQTTLLNRAVSGSSAYAEAKSEGHVFHSHSGDGMALAFYHEVLAPVQTAVEVTRRIRGVVPVRMGIHSGLVLPQIDAGGRESLIGEGLNTAQRVMDFGDAGHILLSAQYAAWLKQFDDWSSYVHPLGEGSAKHNQVITLYSLFGREFGDRTVPSKVKKSPKVEAAPTKKISLLYRPNIEPDGRVLHTLEERLKSLGHQVFLDTQEKITPEWAKAIEMPIRESDAVIAIVSPESLRSEMLEFELETAHDQHSKTGKPVLLPVRIGLDLAPNEALVGSAATIVNQLHSFFWKGPEEDERLFAELISAITEPIKLQGQEVRLEPLGGSVSPDSPFYVTRDCDKELYEALEARESILLVKGARQIGKTSLLAQGTRRSRESGSRILLTDFQKFTAAQISSDETFYRLLAATVARQLKFDYDFARNWDPIFGPNLNLENFLRDLVDSSDQQVVWYMDEVDKLFTTSFATDFFGLIRSWHNSRSTELDGPWGRLTIVIAYATEAHLFIQDVNQSPFNVGRKFQLDDFNLQQTIELNSKYRSPLATYAECEALFGLVAGHPFLTRSALDALAKGRDTLTSLLDTATRDNGPFSDHLKRLLIAVSRIHEVTEYARAVLAGSAPGEQDAFYRLSAAGVVRKDLTGKVVFRCSLYRAYLERMLAPGTPA